MSIHLQINKEKNKKIKMKSSKVPRAEKLLRVGLYDLEKTLGKGNFAIVKLGVHKLTKTKVAVKIVNKHELDDDNLNKISRKGSNISGVKFFSPFGILYIFSFWIGSSFLPLYHL